MIFLFSELIFFMFSTVWSGQGNRNQTSSLIFGIRGSCLEKDNFWWNWVDVDFYSVSLTELDFSLALDKSSSFVVNLLLSLVLYCVPDMLSLCLQDHIPLVISVKKCQTEDLSENSLILTKLSEVMDVQSSVCLDS